MRERQRLPSVEAEFRGAPLPDARLVRRLVTVADSWAEAPDKSIPVMSGSLANREATYRFLGNERVEFDAILSPHLAQSRQRAADAKRVLVLHDTSAFKLEGERGEELGYLNTGSHGFFLHASVGVVAEGETRECVGVLGARVFTRQTPPAKRGKSKKRSGSELAKKENREASRWWEQVDDVEQQMEGKAELIHVTDSEGHKYELLEKLVKANRRFVIRMAREQRARRADEVEWSLLSTLMGEAEDVTERTVALPRRSSKRPPVTKKKFPDRDARKAVLHFGKMVLTLKKPSYLGSDVAPEVTVNVVRVYEVDAPKGTEPIEWILFTSERIESRSEVLAVVDAYRKRWVIEDFFKAVKTGTKYERRQLESGHAWLNALAISMPIAWRLMAIRTAARERPDAPATEIFSKTELAVLKHRLPTRLPPNPTRRQAMLVLAELGGHIKSNGEPGWQSLHHGLMKVLPLAEGIELGREM